MDDYKSELCAVKLELSDIEVQLDDLLQRQGALLDRKDELEKLLRQSTQSPPVQNNEQWDKTDFAWSSKLQEKLESVFKINNLRPMQLQTMNLTMSNKDCILIMPTGGGKSLCFQLPALLSKGVTLVVSPLVSLMEDQVMSLHTYNINAAMLNAATSKTDLKDIQDSMIEPGSTLKLLYVTPEKLAKSKRFMARLEKMFKMGRFARLVIDEVHCCSQWGHDFRPDYKFLGIMKRQFPGVPILGLTATATTNVLGDVKKMLNIQDCHLFRASFNRPNLYYEVRAKPSAHKDVMDELQSLIKSRFHNQSGIIYTFSKKESGDVTAVLRSHGIKAGCYHADMTANQRSQVHKGWIANQIHVVVATVAFGMGIDKPDVRYVIHHSLSKSMENLYQESGRAGRDERKSHCIVYYRFQDVFRQSSMVMTEQTGLRNLYGIMEYCTDVSRCRRSMIARYFGEVWEASQCNRMCDHCNSNVASEKKDITLYCNNVMKIIDNANSIDQKLTAIKLLDAWQGKGSLPVRVKEAETCTDRDKLERILAYMLHQDYIREDFHFTPYTTISYLVAGPKAEMIRKKRKDIFLDMPGKHVKTSLSASSLKDNSSSKPTNRCKPSKTLENSSKPKLVIVNDQKSVFSNMVSASSEDTGAKGDNSVKIKKSNSLTLKKRKTFVIDSGSDSDGLDFGDESNKRKSGVKKAKSVPESQSSKKHKMSEKSEFIGVTKKKVVMIESDSDEIEVTGDSLGHKGNNSSSSLSKGDNLNDDKAVQLLDSDSDFE